MNTTTAKLTASTLTITLGGWNYVITNRGTASAYSPAAVYGATVRRHTFERAGLGLAPYRFTGMTEKVYQACRDAPVQPGSSCDYCGTAIRYEFWLLSSDGRRFKAGCECIRKSGDRGLIKVAEAAERKQKREAAKRAKLSRVRRLFTLLTMAAVIDQLKAQPHPLEWRAEQGDTLLDWAAWMLRCSGTAGRTKVARVVEPLAKAAGLNPRKVDEGTLAAAVAALDPEPEPEPVVEPDPVPESEWFGTVGQRLDFDATIEVTIPIPGGRWGDKTLYKFTDADGNMAAWFNSGGDVRHPDGRFAGKGDRVKVRGTVKQHSTYQGDKQTTLTRCKVEIA